MKDFSNEDLSSCNASFMAHELLCELGKVRPEYAVQLLAILLHDSYWLRNEYSGGKVINASTFWESLMDDLEAHMKTKR
jgi:hypothetical protein